jgi:hypothetical protein
MNTESWTHKPTKSITVSSQLTRRNPGTGRAGAHAPAPVRAVRPADEGQLRVMSIT